MQHSRQTAGSCRAAGADQARETHFQICSIAPIPPGKREEKYRQPWIGRGLQLREILHTGKMRNRLPMGVSDAMCPWNGPAGVRYGTMRCVHKALMLIYDLDVAGFYTA